jgi:GNAT superfamily N-acetyltransferase
VRVAVEVRAVRVDELSAVAAVCAVGRSESFTGAQLCANADDAIKEQLGVLLSVPGGHVLVASVDGAIVGLVLARVVGPNGFLDKRVLYLESLYVLPEARRRGVGHALIAGTAELAATEGAVDVYAVPIPGARGVQRFLARIGFAPAATHRFVSTAVLQRRILAEGHPAWRRHTQGRAGLEELIARRRRSRSEGRTGPVDLRAVEAGLRELPAGGERLVG